jgi:hypothetical protein
MSQFRRKLRPHFVSLKFSQVSYCPETPVSEVPGWLGAVRKVFRQTGRIRPLVVLSVAVFALGSMARSYGQVVSCPSGFSSTGTCGVGGSQNFNPVGPAPSLSGSRILLVPSGTRHQGSAVNYTTKVNVQAFTANFTFVPNGQNIAFVVQNVTAGGNGLGNAFNAGAGCGSGFYQAFNGCYALANNVFALKIDSYSPLTNAGCNPDALSFGRQGDWFC